MNSTTASSKYWQSFTRPVAQGAPVIVAAIVCVALIIGWRQSDEEYLTPDDGLGYWLGVIGSLMMLTLLIYSYRKRKKSRSAIGSVPTWFRIHMFLGVFGPVLIVFHSNFRLGALNSNVALFTMLTVAISGVIGRYIYGKIHMGLYGRRAAAQDILSDVESIRRQFGEKNQLVSKIFDEIDAFGRQVIDNPAASVASSLWFGGVQQVRSWRLGARLRHEIQRLVDVEARADGWSRPRRRQRVFELNEVVTLYFNTILKAAELRFYERLFNLWHVLHLPLFFLMVLAALVHVWAVHKY